MWLFSLLWNALRRWRKLFGFYKKIKVNIASLTGGALLAGVARRSRDVQSLRNLDSLQLTPPSYSFKHNFFFPDCILGFPPVVIGICIQYRSLMFASAPVNLCVCWIKWRTYLGTRGGKNMLLRGERENWSRLRKSRNKNCKACVHNVFNIQLLTVRPFCRVSIRTYSTALSSLSQHLWNILFAGSTDARTWVL